MTIRSARRIRATALVMVSSGRWARIIAPRSSRVNQATRLPSSTACWPRASRKKVLPVPEGPQTTRFSLRESHSRVRRDCWVGAGIEEAPGSQVVKVLPVGNPAALRRAASMDRARPVVSSTSRALRTSAGSQRWARAVASTSAAIPRAWGIFSCRNSASKSAGSAGAAVFGVWMLTGLPPRCWRYRGRPSRRCPGSGTVPRWRCASRCGGRRR
ncbi:Uncharacterised protein [Streptococcus pneumoniae]|nr:Uncharacterised protein [Streptococcus pneumoniae]VOG53262.1 Uncharacterised protein [Streptococcus pneumoniae]